MLEFTPEQRLAIDSRERSLIVSAAAGSGKTAVLAERVLGLICDSEAPCGIDELLVVTFTNAAAAEMKERISRSIAERLAAEPGNTHLRRQMALIGDSRIQTVHAFCQRLLRENAELCGIPSDFALADHIESGQLMQRALDEALEEAYSREDDGDFAELCRTVNEERGDSQLCAALLDVYERLRSHPEPESWLRRAAEEAESFDPRTSRWCAEVLHAARGTAEFAGRRVRAAYDRLQTVSEAADKYGEAFGYCMEFADALLRALDEGWQAAYELLHSFVRPKLRAARCEDKEFLEEMKAEKELFCERVERLRREYLAVDAPRLAEENRRTLGATRAFCRLISEIDRRYAEEKLRKKLLDFSDLEHFAYRLLSDGSGGRSALAERLGSRFREILIDEYQDTNEVQESIFRMLRPERGSMFFVGDVKQSIYRFRLAEPSIFMRRYLAGSRFGESGEEKSMELSRNFRSRPEVLELCNFVFSRIMSAQLGEVDYDERQSLRAGRAAAGAEPVEVYVIDGDSEDGQEEKASAEARFVAARISRMLDGERISGADGESRPVRPGDVAILLSSYANKAYLYGRELARLGIPSSGAGRDEFYSSVEISVMMSLLRIIDNRRQDIPLISVMRSPLYFFTPDELAEIRLARREGDYYDALLACAENEHVKRLLADLEKYTRASYDMTPEQLLRFIYAESGAPGVFSALDRGGKRRENLEKLRVMAADFSASHTGGLYAFLRYMDKKAELDEYPESPESGDAVRIMSIHKSKGLEFPVVFVPDLAKRFNIDDLTRPVLFHKELGVAFKCRDSAARTECRSQFQRAVTLRMRRELLSEEMRKLYVALTRARDKLVLTMAVRDPQVRLAAISGQARGGMETEYLAEQNNAMAWICAALTEHAEAGELRGEESADGSSLICRIVRADGVGRKNAPPQQEIAAETDGGEELGLIDWQYEYAAAARLPSKLTPTGIRGEYPEAGEAEGVPGSITVRMFREVELRPAGRRAREAGTDIHRILSMAEFEKCGTPEGAAAEVRQIAERIGLEPPEGAARMVHGFAGSYAGQRMREADRVLREYQFGVFFTPDELRQSGGAEDRILMNGAIDMLLFASDGMRVIDFKSDSVAAGEEQEQAEKHRLQLEIYARAAEKIFGLPVRERIVHFLRTGRSVVI
ncbi:MAG: helicase-exonuclease AddAB subunit AddA [Clostridia bacterium]|nr:helicase-exonuclease AddAB subunit AddA [Clostridia bacterium]